jgi:hypothetical protein
MPVPGKLEITVKINTMPTDVSIDANGWRSFVADCDRARVTIRLRPRVWNKLTQAAAEWPLWIASITGAMGPSTAEGFELGEPNLQVFERKAKVEPAAIAVPAPHSGRG